MDAILSFIDNELNRVGIVIGVLTIIPVLLTFWEVRFGSKRRHKIWFEEARKTKGQYPSMLIVDLLPGKDIVTSVERCRQEDDILKTIDDDRIFCIERGAWLKPDDMPDFIKEVRDKAAEIIRAGTDTLHLFYAGPVAPMAIIGAEFSNTCRVLLYQHNTENKYINFGPLRHDQPTF